MSQQQSPSRHCNSIRRIVCSTHASAPDFRALKWQIAEHFAHDNTLEPQWAQFIKDYEEVVDDSRSAAAKLSAIINMYTSLLSAFQKAQVADVVHELETFKKSAPNAAALEFGSRLQALQCDVNQFLNSISPPAKNTEQKGPRVDWVGLASFSIHAVVHYLLWSPLAYVGMVLSPTPTRGIGNSSKRDSRPNDDGQDAARKPEPESAQDVITNIRKAMDSLEAQIPMFDVFKQISNELVAEFSWYSCGLEGTPESPVNVEAVHAAAAKRAEEWKELARVLSHEYARA